MNRQMLVIVVILCCFAAGFYFYQQNLCKKQIMLVEQSLENFCDPEQEDCLDVQDDVTVL